MAEAFSVAVVPVTSVAACVVTEGDGDGTKERTAPNDVPVPFEATAQKKYVWPVVRPLSEAVYGCAPLPEPRSVPPIAGERVPNESLQVPGLVVE